VVYQGEWDLANTGVFRHCITDYRAARLKLAEKAQEWGAIGLIVFANEKIIGGRIVGFASKLSIPVIVVGASTLDYLVFNTEPYLEVELSAISPSEDNTLTVTANGYFTWVVINSAIYTFLCLLLGYMLVVDIVVCTKKKKLSRNIILKAVAWIEALVALLWHFVDPYGFKMLLLWPSGFFVSFTDGLNFSILLLVLNIWIMAWGKARCKIETAKFCSYIIYVLVAITIVLELVRSILWYDATLYSAHEYFSFFILAVCMAGFIYFGKDMVSIMCRSGNRTPKQNILPTKIVVVIIWFMISTIIAGTVLIAGSLGDIFGHLFSLTMSGIGIMLIFLCLFFKRKRELPTNSIQFPALNPQEKRIEDDSV